MESADVFARCAEHRLALADWIESLDDAQLATPSLCGAWDVHTVAAHLTVLIAGSRRTFLAAMLRSRGSFDRANDAVARAQARRPVAELATILRQKSGSTATPPVGGPRAPLADLLVHTADMRIPLGLDVDPPRPDVALALDFLSAGGIGFVPRGRLRGIVLTPTDLDRAWGAGAPVRGRAVDLLLAACGRPVFDRLSGDGLALLSARN